MRIRFSILVDALLALAFICVMVSPLGLPEFHEIVGTCIFGLAIVHALLNLKRIKGLIKAKRALAKIELALDLLLALGIVLMIASALVLSRYVFSWLPAIPGSWWARTVHMCCSAWLFCLAFAHLGLHLKEVAGKLYKNRIADWTCRVIWGCALLFGTYAAIQLLFFDYLTFNVRFAAFGADLPLAFQTTGYASIAIAVTGIAHYLYMLGSKLSSKRKKVEE